MNDLKMTTGELALRYGIKPHTISNWSTQGIITPVGKRINKNLYLVSEIDAFYKTKNPKWKASATKGIHKRTKSIIQMPLDSPLGTSSEQANTGYMPIAQVAELLKAMAKS